MKYTLKNEKFTATVNTFGAYLEEFFTDDGKIFFPRMDIKIGNSTKPRGGMHVCYPNFSVDDITSLPVHGFGRDNEWSTVKSSDSSIELKLCGVNGYENLVAFIKYEIKNDGLNTTLTIENNTDKPQMIAPAFHPYFYSKNQKVNIDGFSLDGKILEDSVFLEANSLTFETSDKKYEIFGDNISIFTIWTDRKNDYICVEPTYNGPSFKKDYDKEPLVLKEGEKFSQKFTIRQLF